jgi:large subunit ribosomal protein L17
LAHRIDGRKLGRPTDHRLALFRNLVTDLLRHEKIITTEAKAKEVRGIAEKVITLGKRGDLTSRRRALSFVYDKKVVEKVFAELGPRYQARPGGYTRIVKLGPRRGDGARMAQLELVGGEE